jgi:2-methylisocitrate lyase-like PEP mutase family enzyme
VTPELFPEQSGGAAALRRRLAEPGILIAPGCFDALTARLVEMAGHEAVFCGGFSVAASRLGLPDVGLLSYGEMVDQVRSTASATSLPVIADADTGYGNAINAQRSLLGFQQAGAACVMIEDQRWPKRCGHTTGKEVVDRQEAVARVRACVEIRDRRGLDILIMARTDATASEGFDEALRRADAFSAAGADLTFLEAPESEAQMARYCEEVPGHKVANMVEEGLTPWLSPAELTDIGYSIVLYPVSLLLHGVQAMGSAAERLKLGVSDGERARFDEVRSLVGWPAYEDESARFGETTPSDPNDSDRGS